MNIEEEPESPIPYADEEDVGDEQRPLTNDSGQYNLTITRNYENKTRRVEVSKILQDVDHVTNHSLSPTAPLAEDGENLTESDADGPHNSIPTKGAGTCTGAEFELTIKSNNSIIKIQGFDNNSTISFNAGKGSRENVYDLLSREVDKILSASETQEMEKARIMKSSQKCERKVKAAKQKKGNSWKVLTKSLMSMRKRDQRRGSVERYPKMVLLKDPEPATVEEVDEAAAVADIHPKMFFFEDGRKVFQKGKRAFGGKHEGVNKTEPTKGRPSLKAVNQITADEKVGMDLRQTRGDLEKEINIIADERLCMELEKQLIGEEKAALREEMELLKKEKEVLEKERCLPGEGKKFYRKRHEMQDGDADNGGAKKATPEIRNIRCSADEDVSYSSVPPLYGTHERPHCPPAYVPVYASLVPYCHRGNLCCAPRLDSPVQLKHSTTQTEPLELIPQSDVQDESKDLELPFGLLSTFFPRIVVIKSFQEEVASDDAEVKMFEISGGESPILVNEKEDEMGCEESEFLRGVGFGIEEDKQKMENEVRSKNREQLEESMTGAREQEERQDLPLTKIGRSIYEKLNDLASQRKREAEVDEHEAETGFRKSSHVTLGFRSRLTKSKTTSGEHDLQIRDGNQEDEEGTEAEQLEKYVVGDAVAVRKCELWHSCNSERPRKDEAHARVSGAISLSVSEGDSVIFSVRRGEEGPRKPTKEAKVGTDGIDVVGGDYVLTKGADIKNLSPRTGTVLKSLKDTLEKTEGISRPRTKDREIKFPGIFFIEPVESKRAFPCDDFLLTTDRGRKMWKKPEVPVPGKPREYYCEECLATMRLLEDENLSVRNIVDKFETIIHLGSY